MKNGWLWTLTLAALLVTGAAWADDETDDETKDDPVAKALGKLAKLGPGVHAIKKDDNGRIKTCVVIGESRISTALGKGKGLETARTRARLAAAAEFRKWLKEKVTVHEKSESETITLVEGSEDPDNDVVKESGKAIEKTSTRYETVASGLVRGLQVLHVTVNGEDKVYTLVLGWDAKTAKAAGKIDDDKDEDKIDEKKPRAKSAEVKKSKKTKIGSAKTTSDDAKKFLP